MKRNPVGGQDQGSRRLSEDSYLIMHRQLQTKSAKNHHKGVTTYSGHLGLSMVEDESTSVKPQIDFKSSIEY